MRSVDALIRSMAVGGSLRHMLLLGAGASVTSGVASAWGCIGTWKRDIYLSANRQVRPQLYEDPTLPGVQNRIQGWLDAQGRVPPAGDPSEYSFFAEECYPDPRDRRKFFEGLVGGAQPAIGYQCLGLLAAAGHFRWVWTTNFDDLVVSGLPQGHARIVRSFGLDSTSRLSLVEPDETALNVVRLHGDYRYDALRNTDEELKSLDADFSGQLAHRLDEYPLVVLGYSGGDASVMDALRAAMDRPGKGGLYWVGLRGHTPRPEVSSLIELAASAGRQAVYLEADGFDPFMVNLARYVLRSEPWEARLSQLLETASVPAPPLSLDQHRTPIAFIKSNCWPVRAPEFVYEVEEADLGWEGLRELLDGDEGRISAGITGGRVIALGHRDEIEERFSSPVTQVPIAPRELFWEDSVVLGVLKEAMAHALADADLVVRRLGRRWYIVDGTTRNADKGINNFHAVEVRLEQRANELFLSLIPDRWVPRKGQERRFADGLGPLKTLLLGRQWNQAYNNELNAWIGKLGLRAGDKKGGSSRKALRFVFPKGAETGCEFLVKPGPLFTGVYARRGRGIRLRGPSSHYRFRGFQLEEPALRFGRGSDTNPVRGLVTHGPVESPTDFGSGRIRIGVVAPESLGQALARFLDELARQHGGIESKQEYLVEYPGFSAAFGLHLDVPVPGAPGWCELARPSGRLPAEAQFRTVLEQVVRGVESVATVADVVLVAVPRSWAPFERLETDGGDLDLHDQVKAFCAPRGIPTQLLRERTFSKRHKAEVLWWLALALYAKSRRTPWLLDRPDEDVAYVGLGHAVDGKGKASQIVLGCSHVFQSTGVGLRFHLSRVKEPIWFGKNPYLGREDAFRIGIQTRQLFLESLGRFPSRVLVCKKLPFRREELAGLRAGLSNVESVDFLTLEQEHAWRYLASDPKRGGASMFPIQRGTGVLLDHESFFLWVHGAAEGMNPRNRTYYQGKTRIPSPVRVRRYGGHSTLEQLGRDLLGLSKMDWNSFDLYGQMPAPVSTPSKIAKIGRLVERLGAEALDYRLFM